MLPESKRQKIASYFNVGKPKRSIMLCGHGSRSEPAVAEFANLVFRLKTLLPNIPIEFGYLEFAKPIISDGLDKLREAGVTEIVALPAMLFAAGHAKNDIPSVLNTYNYKYFTSLYDKNISSFSLLLQSANSISNDNVKLSERLFIPSSRLRGFERGKVGPKDGTDFIGGNFATAINFNTTLPVLFENAQNLEAALFLDIANIWGVDYDSSIDDEGKIRSSVGIGLDWFTIIGPLNFSISETLTKEDSDITESFRFNIGTTF